MSTLRRWIDDRTGLGEALEACRARTVPGRVCLRHAWPATLVFTFAVQAITGLILLMYYSPSAQTAWEGVYYLQYEVQGGWLLRAIHHYTGQAMLVLVAFYVIHMVLLGTYRAPRELVFWAAVFMGILLLGLLLTGDLLVWDQNGQSSTLVRTRFLTLLPWVGKDLFKLAVGGPAFGHLTLSRFLALHAGVLSGLFLVVLVKHEWLAWRADRSQLAEAKIRTPYWPNQAIVDAAACLVVMGVVLGLSLCHGISGDQIGVPLGAPADPGTFYDAARPEWAFLGLYQFARLFPAQWEILPIFVIPGLIVCLLLLMPFIGRVSIGHWFNILALTALLVGDVVLSYIALAEDARNAAYQTAVRVGRQESRRVVELIRQNQGIPAAGALALLRNDPQTQGPRLFAQQCASCHNWTDAAGDGIRAEQVSAPNLHGFGTRKWLAGLLDPKTITRADYFGNTKFKHGDMEEFVEETFANPDEMQKRDRAAAIAALSAEAALPSQAQSDKNDARLIQEGRKFIMDDFGCTDCHKFHDKGRLGKAPELTGYASRQWIIGIISNPAHKRFYGKLNDRMPAFAENPGDPAKNLLSDRDIALLADWLREQ